ncbi:MAG: hypothetical protein EBU90_19070 [Proteobacteria bacterium]|nr:hypothetical protein [Pseudomonadota bacterium]
MSQLIQLRQRLKAIGTFKKITGAMRIVSRSLHTRMNKQKKHLLEYQQLIQDLFFDLQGQSQWTCDILFPEPTAPEKILYVIVGAQKGLCGNYNTELNYWIENNLSVLKAKNVSIMTFGKKTSNLIKQHSLDIFQQAPELKNSTLEALADTLTNLLLKSVPSYTQVFLVHAHPETFFTHRLKKDTLIPFEKKQEEKSNDTFWQHCPKLILDTLAHMYLHCLIYNALFSSLLGEQSARFLAMDNATRSANNLLDTMQLQYNKIRQTKITRELTELSSNFK